jgi:hypothetical protein
LLIQILDRSLKKGGPFVHETCLNEASQSMNIAPKGSFLFQERRAGISLLFQELRVWIDSLFMIVVPG